MDPLIFSLITLAVGWICYERGRSQKIAEAQLAVIDYLVKYNFVDYSYTEKGELKLYPLEEKEIDDEANDKEEES